MDFAEIIKIKITEALKPTKMHIENHSHLHSGHAGDNGTGQTHFYAEIESESFRNLSRVEASRMVHLILEEELSNGIHSLSLKLSPPN
jgi:BolA protein